MGIRSVWIAIAVCAVAVTLSEGAQAAEFRAFYIDAWGAGIRSKSEVQALLGTVGSSTSKGAIRDANCNAVVVQVRRRADVCYPSAMGEPYYTGLSPSNYNALADIIAAAHDTTGGKQRIEVHCWICTLPVTSTSSPPSNSIYYQHDDPSDSANYWITRDSSGAEGDEKFFDPGHPKCLQYLTDVCMDLVNNYDIDGLHHDYIRYGTNLQGYNPTSIARYNARYGLSGSPDASNEQFRQWRRDQVTALARKVYANILAVKPWVKHSASVVTGNPSPTASTRTAFRNTRPYYEVYSDWDAWLTEGIIDIAVPMTYYNQASLPTDYTRWMDFTKDRKAGRHVVIGPGIYLNSLSNALTQLSLTRNASASGNYGQGFCGYSYRVPYASGTWSGFYPSFVSQLCPSTTTIPTMSWKSAPTKGHIMGTVTIGATGVWADGATVTAVGASGTSRSMTCDGTGFYAFIDLPPDTYTVTASFSGYSNKQATAGVTAGVMSTKNFVMGDSVPPVISSVTASSVTNSSAVISWTTDKLSNSKVDYGIGNYNSSTGVNSALVTSHSMTLSGLAAHTTYQYRVTSADSSASATSSGYSFTTSGPPTISNVQVASTTATSAAITWTTNVGASSQVRYGATSSYGSQTSVVAGPNTSHSITVTGLTPGATYHFQAVSANAYGTAQSSDRQFTTLGPPVISSVAAVPGAYSAAVTWTTDLPSNSQVEYGATTSYGSTTALDAALVTSHSVSVTGLSPSTLYHYRVRSSSEGGITYSPDATFTTLAFDGEVIVDNTDPGFQIVLGTNWLTGTTAVKYGTNYIYATGVAGTAEADATNIARWTPTLPTSGLWDVYVFYASGTNRSTNSYWKVVGASSTQTLRVNQQTGGNGWQLLASNVPLLAGANGYVELGNNVGATDKIVQGDAVKFTYRGGDVQAPSVPANLTATASGTNAVTLAWSPSIDDVGVATYKVYRGGTLIASPTAPSYSDSALAANTSYSYQVLAADAAGNTSALTAAAGCVTLSVPPSSTTVTSVRSVNTWYPSNGFQFTAVGGFGAGKVTRYRVAWNQSQSYAWGQPDEVNWQAGSILRSATAQGSWYMHLMGYNSAGVPNGEMHIGPFKYDPAGPIITSVDDGRYTTSTSQLILSWTGSDSGSGIQKYEYCIGSVSGELDVRGWTNAALATSVNVTGLALERGATYYVGVRATDNAGNLGQAVWSSGVTVVGPLARIADAKACADGTAVGLNAKRITGVFGDILYIEDSDGSSGIRVEQVTGFAAGDTVLVSGILSVVDGCERAITSARASAGAAVPAPRSRIIQQTQLGGEALNAFTPAGRSGYIGLNNVGLLVTTAGVVTNVESDGFVVWDGSDIVSASGYPGVKVWTGSAPGVAINQWVRATGVCSAMQSGGQTVPFVRLTVPVQNL